MILEELEFRRRCPYDAFGDYSDVLKEIRQKEKENKTDTVSVTLFFRTIEILSLISYVGKLEIKFTFLILSKNFSPSEMLSGSANIYTFIINPFSKIFL